MKIAKADLKGLKGKDLDAKIKEAKGELLKLQAQLRSSAPPKNPHALKNLRRAVARMLTMKRAQEFTQKT